MYETSCVRWSPSSDLLVYEKDHELYYYALAQAKSGRVLDESLRHVGAGRLASVAWASNGQLLYLSGSMVYEIQVAELFTRSLYQDFLKIGRIIGRLPHVFDPNFDRFWLSPDSRVLLLAKGETYLYLYPMHEESQVDGRAWELPLLALPRAASLTQVIWTSENSLIIILQSPDKQGTMRSLVYRMDMTADLPVFKLSESPLIRRVDTDGSTAVVQYADKIGLLAVADWKSQKEYKHPDPLWTFKVGNDGIIVLGKWYAEYIKTSTDQRTFLFFSQAEALGYDNETGLLSIQSKDQSYSLNEQRWLKRSPLTLRAPSTANSLVRVYAEELYSGTYNNIIMTRKVKELGTKALFNAPATAFEAFPTAEEAIDLTLFNHGSRIRSRSVALTFNAIDSAEGLGEILAVLKHYNIKATFFVNGEFMRRYPAAVRELADSGQEIGSLFYTWFNLADQRYRIDTAFLKQGLARNEDEYREITGKEISLLWRTPYFVVNRSVLEAAASLHYTVVGTDVDSLDSVTRDGGRDSGLYRRSAVLVEEILSRKKPGSIISLTVGKPGEHDANSLGRSDFLFQKLDVLINGLIQKGYDIVPVSHLLESAQ